MKKIIYLILLFPILVNAQIKLVGKVIDAKTKQEIPYVNIENFRIQAGTQTNQAGLFELNIVKGKQTDTLKISCVGYADKYITNLLSNEAVIYELLPVVFQLNEVKVSNKEPVEIEVGVINNKGVYHNFSNYVIQQPGAQRAVFMNYIGGKQAYLKCINFYIGKKMFNAPFKVIIYANNSGLPGKNLLNTDIEFIAKKKNAWNEIDMSNYYFEVPETGFFVAVEWIANYKYKKIQEQVYVKDNGTTGKKKIDYFGPEIIEKFDTQLGLTFMRVLGFSWVKLKGGIGIGENYRDVSIDLLVKATLSVYN